METSQQEPRAAPLLSELSINHPHLHLSAPCPLNQACVPFTSLRLHSLPPLMREAAVVMAALNGAQGGKVYGSLLLNSHPVLEGNRPNRIVDEVRQARWEDKRRKRRQKQTKKKKKAETMLGSAAST